MTSDIPTNLPIEEIAFYLSLHDVCSLRISHPVFPPKTCDALQSKHRWNAKPFSRNVDLSMRADDISLLAGLYRRGDEITLETRAHAALRDRNFLVGLANHRVSGVWITTVCIKIY